MKNENIQITLNGQSIASTYQKVNRLCQCGHNYMAHIHFNGGIPNKPEGEPTYCGHRQCSCDEFKERKYPTTEGSKSEIDRLSERVINLFTLVEIQFGYTLPADFCDEFLVAVKNLSDKAK